MRGPVHQRRPFRIKAGRFTLQLDPAKFRSDDGENELGVRSRNRTPWRFRANAGRGLRRCADGQGHSNGGRMATPNGRRYFLELPSIRLPLITIWQMVLSIAAGLICRFAPKRRRARPKKKPRRLISPRGSFRRVLSGQSLRGDASARAGRSLIRRNCPVEKFRHRKPWMSIQKRPRAAIELLGPRSCTALRNTGSGRPFETMTALGDGHQMTREPINPARASYPRSSLLTFRLLDRRYAEPPEKPNPDLPPEDPATDPDVPPPSGPPVFPERTPLD
jgi:hypothetical protein